MPPALPATAHEVLYVITVHGMGEQRQHDTSLPILNRFAEARGRDSRRPIRANAPWYVATREGMLGATGVPAPSEEIFTIDQERGTHPWVERAGIPRHAPTSPTKKSMAGRWMLPKESGDGVRISDILWADIMDQLFPIAGSSTEAWANALVFRLMSKENPPAPYHIRKLMEVLAGTLSLTSRILGYRWPGLRKVLFDQYLGDVQLYAEYPEARGLAVRRFHEWMTRIDYMHCVEEQARINWLTARGEYDGKGPRTARYVILAHSLGTVLAVDALFAAALPVSVRCGRQEDLYAWPWPSYLAPKGKDQARAEMSSAITDNSLRDARDLRAEWEQDPATWPAYEAYWKKLAHYDTSWISRVDRLVTFGSPVDKFLALFWENYQYICDTPAVSTRWQEPDALLSEGHRIVHDNYCDEQDPVGGPLDILQSAPAYAALFEQREEKSGEDLLYSYTAIPGLAHTTYFDHPSFWQRIMDRVIDDRPAQEQEPAWSLTRWSAFAWILFYTYLLWPLLGSAVVLSGYHMLTSIKDPAFSLGWITEVVTAGIVAAAGIWYGRRFIELTLWWRQILRIERIYRQDAHELSLFKPAENALQHAIALIPISCLLVLLGVDYPLWRKAIDASNPLFREQLQDSLGIYAGFTLVLMCIAGYYHFFNTAEVESLPTVGGGTAAPGGAEHDRPTQQKHRLKDRMPKSGASNLQKRRLMSVLENDVIPLAILALVLVIAMGAPLDGMTRAWLYWTGLGLEWVTILWVLQATIYQPWATRRKQETLWEASGRSRTRTAPEPEPDPAVVRGQVGGLVFGLVLLVAAITFVLLPYYPSPPIMILDQRTVVAICVYLFMYWTVVKFWEIKARLWKHCGDQPSVGLFAPYAGVVMPQAETEPESQEA